MSRHLAKTNPSHKGFEVTGPNGIHSCLVLEPMRESLELFRRRLKQSKFMLELLKAYLKALLQGLDYMHSECHIIHTGEVKLHPTSMNIKAHQIMADLNLNNILVAFEDSSVIERFVRAQAEHPMPRKIVDGRSIYQSQDGFGPLVSHGGLIPKMLDFGLAQQASPPPQIFPIQSDPYRAREVVLGTGWTYSADIWNIGVLGCLHLHHTSDNLPNTI
ncbi:MAG: hypothetical protein M1826_002393 [Phylliscum demangeonii]|nr:MAG: hypothetical protein M1826_002393 [Phylliscum demangeonii]